MADEFRNEDRRSQLSSCCGFPSSSYPFHDLMPLLADQSHVTAPDFPGMGFREGAGIMCGLLKRADSQQFTVDTSRLKNVAMGASANLSLIQK